MCVCGSDVEINQPTAHGHREVGKRAGQRADREEHQKDEERHRPYQRLLMIGLGARQRVKVDLASSPSSSERARQEGTWVLSSIFLPGLI